jgi:hypothetical protein
LALDIAQDNKICKIGRKAFVKNLYTSVFYIALLLNKNVQARLGTYNVTLWRVVHLMAVAVETQQCIPLVVLS